MRTGARGLRFFLRRGLALVPVVLLFCAGLVLHRELRAFHVADVREALGELPLYRVLLAVGATCVSYGVLTFYDVLALRYVKRPVSYPRVALTSFIAYAFGHNLGFSTLSGGSVRYRMYSQWGLSAFDCTQVVALCAVTFWLGVAATGAWSFPFAGGSGRWVGGLLFLGVMAYVLAAWRLRRPVQVRGLSLSFPPLGLAVRQVLVGCVDWWAASAVLFFLLPARTGLPFFALVSLFIVAQVAGLVSHVPGGLGVFESVMLSALSPRLSSSTALGLLVAYRALYYLAPFVLAGLLLVGTESVKRRGGITRLARGLHASFAPLVPPLAAAVVAVCGAVLVVTGALPALPFRLSLLRRGLPMPVLEVSHLVASLSGVALLLLGRGLQRRVNAAYGGTLVLLALGVVAALARGLDGEEALLLALVFAALLPFREEFYRRSALMDERFTWGWVLCIAGVLVASFWIGLLAYEGVPYRHELFWQFALDADVSRFLRASMAVMLALVAFAAARLLRPARPVPAFPLAEEKARARKVVEASPSAAAHLALVGDKALLFNEAGTAFLMYGVSGNSFVAMGDPLGPEVEGTELAFRLVAMAERQGAHACFYEVGTERLSLYLDLGLSLLKMGEEARVPLATFSLEGPLLRSLRQACHTASKRFTFEWVPSQEVAPLLPVLREVSDAWLAQKHGREKGFSVGYFDEAYLREGPMALLRQQERIVAFANVWTSGARQELSIDLMRHLPTASHGAMEYLLTQLMLWGKAQGFGCFNLGMAPFAGMEAQAPGQLWTQTAGFLFRHGERFYGFQGLRHFKDKFRPVWSPRYVALPGGRALPSVLTDILSLVARGPRRV